jgi:serine/threonine protein kinase
MNELILENNIKKVKQSLKTADPDDNFNPAIILASELGRVEIFKLLRADSRTDPFYYNNQAIRVASKNGHIDILKLLLDDEYVDPDDINIAFRQASEHGHVEIVRFLLADQRVDPADQENIAIRTASENGYVEIVKLLLADPRVNPNVFDNQAIYDASENGHVEVVRLLLADERVDPTDRTNGALEIARENGQRTAQVVQLLLTDPRVKQLDDAQHPKISDDENEKIKLFAISQFMQDDKKPVASIREIYKTENTTSLSNEFIDTVIRHSMRQYKQENLSAMDHMAIISNLERSMSRFEKSEWTEEKTLGEGTYGKVCRIKKEKTTLALKIFKNGLHQDVIREIGCYALLTAANTKYSPKIHGMIIERDTVNITLDLAKGTFKDYYETINYGQRMKLFSHVSEMAIKCVEEFHSCGLIHGDIKPANMLAWWDGENLCKLVLSDFGISSSRPDIDGQVYTLPYRAPELFLNNHIHANRATDVFALGKTLQEFLLKSTSDVNQPTLKTIPRTEKVLQMLSPDPDTRLKLNEYIFTFPKRKWSMGNFTMEEIMSELTKIKEKCNEKNYRKATFLQTCDITFRHCVFVPEKLRWPSALLIASNWGEYDTYPIANLKENKISSLITVLQSLNGLVYLPGLEYLENKSWEEIISAIENKLSETKNN